MAALSLRVGVAGGVAVEVVSPVAAELAACGLTGGGTSGFADAGVVLVAAVVGVMEDGVGAVVGDDGGLAGDVAVVAAVVDAAAACAGGVGGVTCVDSALGVVVAAIFGARASREREGGVDVAIVDLDAAVDLAGFAAGEASVVGFSASVACSVLSGTLAIGVGLSGVTVVFVAAVLVGLLLEEGFFFVAAAVLGFLLAEEE